MRSSFPFTPSPTNLFGEVTGLVQDLATVAGRRRDAQRVRVSSEDADLEVIRVLDAPPSVVWQYYRFAARRKSLAGLAARCPCCIAPTTRSKRSRRSFTSFRACVSYFRYNLNTGHIAAPH